jgi:hypothetical protein
MYIIYLHKTSLHEIKLWDHGRQNSINVEKIQESIDEVYSLEDQVEVDDK